MGDFMQRTVIEPAFVRNDSFQHYPAETFPTIHPVHWLHSHFAVGGWSPLQRLSGMLTAHMTRIAPRSGFTWHPHRGLEIYTWVLEGRLSHEDTTGGKGDIHAGELQRMFSGAYIEHQELNRTDDPVRVIQIWFLADPSYIDTPPHYQQVGKVDLPSRKAGDGTVIELIGGQSPMAQHMTGRLTATTISAGGETTLETPRDGEDLFVYVTDGQGTVQNGNRHSLNQYDVMLARPDADTVTICADTALDYLCFYLPSFLS